MGSCISKCKPKKKPKEEDDSRRHVVHDKLVISKDPPTAPEVTIMPPEKPLSPARSTSSAASISSFSCSGNSKSGVASSISSSASSLSSASSTSYNSTSVLKERSFSNDFLRSCARENPHVVGLNGEKTALFPHYKIHSDQNLKAKQTLTALEKTLTASTPKKRARAASPTLVRQKSFRREQSCPNRGLRSSPSPSRRFNGESNGIFPVKESYYSKPVVSRRNTNAVSSAPKRESFRASPKIESSIGGEYSVREKEAFLKRIGSKIGGSNYKEMDDVVMEDINNPLIALDCFIFL